MSASVSDHMTCRAQAQHGEASLADALTKSSKAGAELTTLRSENQQLMQVRYSSLAKPKQVVVGSEEWPTMSCHLQACIKLHSMHEQVACVCQ